MELPRAPGRVEDLRWLLIAAMLASAHLNCAIALAKLTDWPVGALLLMLMVVGDVAIAALLVSHLGLPTLVGAVLIAVAPLALLLKSAAGVPSAGLGFPGWPAAVLAVLCLLCAVVLLRRGPRLAAQAPISAHARAMALVALIAVTVIGIGATAPAWFDIPSDAQSQPDPGHG